MALIDDLEFRFEEYTLKGAKTSMHISFPKIPGGDSPTQIPTRGPGMIPRRVYLMPNDFAKHGFTQGCPSCTYVQNGIGLKRHHSEACRIIMEEEIGKIASETRADKARKRQDHYMAQQVQQGEQLGEREGNLRKEDIAEPNEDMDDGIAGNVVQDETFIDAPVSNSDIRIKTPDRKKAAQRGIDRHD